MTTIYPWSAVVGQPALKQALLLCAIDPAIGGVLVQGPRGVAKTTLARALSQLCPGRFVELPLGASEERVTGTLDLQAALREGQVAFSPGLLAQAHEGVLYVDEVNLLSDGLVDLLLDAAASGENRVERDGISHQHPARFVLIGTMNPEEGELRPQLSDRFGLCVQADDEIAPPERREIVLRRLAFDRDPAGFVATYGQAQQALLSRCSRARAQLPFIALSEAAIEWVTARCYAAQVEGVRADLAMLRAARAHAAWEGRREIGQADVAAVAELALAHRRRGRGEPWGGGSPSHGSSPGGSPSHGSSSGGLPHHGAPHEAGPSGGASERQGTHGQPPKRGGTPACASAPGGSGEEGSARASQNARPASDAASALAPVPVRPAADVELPWSLRRSLGRGRAPQRMVSRRSRRGLKDRRARCGPVDWFATLARTARPGWRDVRFRPPRAPHKALWVVALDCSASMLRGGALAYAKAAALALTREARRGGVQTALIAFQGASAKVTAEVQAGMGQPARAVHGLGAAGKTPLRAAVQTALALCRRPRFASSRVAKRVLLLTDGRSAENVSDLAAARADISFVIVDCERGPVRLGRAGALARALGGPVLHVDSMRAPPSGAGRRRS